MHDTDDIVKVTSTSKVKVVAENTGLLMRPENGSVTLCGILLFPGVLQFAGKQTRRPATAWGRGAAPLKRDRARAAAREKQLNRSKQK